MLARDVLMIAGVLKSGNHPHYRHSPSCNDFGQQIWGPAIVDFFGYPGAGICPMSRVVNFNLLLDYGDAGVGACFDWPGVG